MEHENQERITALEVADLLWPPKKDAPLPSQTERNRRADSARQWIRRRGEILTPEWQGRLQTWDRAKVELLASEAPGPGNRTRGEGRRGGRPAPKVSTKLREKHPEERDGMPLPTPGRVSFVEPPATIKEV